MTRGRRWGTRHDEELRSRGRQVAESIVGGDEWMDAPRETGSSQLIERLRGMRGRWSHMPSGRLGCCEGWQV